MFIGVNMFLKYFNDMVVITIVEKLKKKFWK